MTTNEQALAEKEKRSAAMSSVVAAVFLTLLKIVVGLTTGSLGILAEALHSALDLVAALVTFFAVRLSDRPPDAQHRYGHGKIENLSALIETVLLLITCIWIFYEAIQRLLFKTVEIEVSIWAFVVMAISIGVDVTRSRMLYRAARKHKSQALEADALHFSTDIWSSSVVILGLALVWLGERLPGEWAWLAKADAVAAMAVGVIVIYVSLQLGRRAIQVLLDAAPAGLAERIAAQASSVTGVQGVGPIRARQAGAFTFVDLTIHVARSASLEEAHQIAADVERQVNPLLYRGDVVVHVDPIRPGNESLPQAIGALAAQHGVRAHNIHAHDVRGLWLADIHVEVDPELLLAEAHDRVTRLEAAIRQELPHIHDVQTHIEPRSLPLQFARPAHESEGELHDQIAVVLGEVGGLYQCHDIRIRPSEDGYDVEAHCLADPDLPIAQAHRLADEAERRLLACLPEVGQALIHIEPLPAN